MCPFVEAKIASVCLRCVMVGGLLDPGHGGLPEQFCASLPNSAFSAITQAAQNGTAGVFTLQKLASATN